MYMGTCKLVLLLGATITQINNRRKKKGRTDSTEGSEKGKKGEREKDLKKF